jgi:hypothetical protein
MGSCIRTLDVERAQLVRLVHTTGSLTGSDHLKGTVPAASFCPLLSTATPGFYWLPVRRTMLPLSPVRINELEGHHLPKLTTKWLTL